MFDTKQTETRVENLDRADEVELVFSIHCGNYNVAGTTFLKRQASPGVQWDN